MADIPDEMNRKVTRVIHDQGIEMTPDEVAETRKRASPICARPFARRDTTRPKAIWSSYSG